MCDFCEQVHSALDEIMKGDCPDEILTEEGNDVAYFNDFENDNSQVGGISSQASNLWAASDFEILTAFRFLSRTSSLAMRRELQ